MGFGPAQRSHIGWSAEQRIGAVEFKAGRTAAGKAEIADDLAFNVCEYPGEIRRVGLLVATIVRTLKPALGGKPDADQLLRGAGLAAPQPAIAAIELMEILARLGRPGAGAAFSAAQFQCVGRGR